LACAVTGGIQAREYRKGRFRRPQAVVLAVRMAASERKQKVAGPSKCFAKRDLRNSHLTGISFAR
jgi:hypothetical protein